MRWCDNLSSCIWKLSEYNNDKDMNKKMWQTLKHSILKYLQNVFRAGVRNGNVHASYWNVFQTFLRNQLYSLRSAASSWSSLAQSCITASASCLVSVT